MPHTFFVWYEYHPLRVVLVEHVTLFIIYYYLHKTTKGDLYEKMNFTHTTPFILFKVF